MPDDLEASGTLRDGSVSNVTSPPTGAYPPVRQGPNWIAAILRNPTQAITLGGLLLLGGVQGADSLQDGDLEEQLAAELASRDERAELEELLARAAVGAESAKIQAEKNAEAIEALARQVQEHGDEQLGFQSEIAQHMDTSIAAFGKKLKADIPKPGPRFTEFVTKGLIRGSRGSGDFR